MTAYAREQKFRNVEERLGRGWNDVEILNYIDKHCLEASDYTQPVLTSRGTVRT